ncbi:uncharacterized protein LOC122075238 [Macadamia integrifolia]|uniref:uncharacterized protein LOC122075238 n=1 Tax=Macadamia integrifolia TaxID=60698 RepID=UPI001C4ED9A8|nr:uncharacterized protein LOC122075238 [Macadamia integrifolia]
MWNLEYLRLDYPKMCFQSLKEGECRWNKDKYQWLLTDAANIEFPFSFCLFFPCLPISSTIQFYFVTLLFLQIRCSSCGTCIRAEVCCESRTWLWVKLYKMLSVES